MTQRRWRLAALCAWSIMLISPSAQAQGDTGVEADEMAVPSPATEPPPATPPSNPALDEARVRITAGEELFARGDYNAALAEFERANELLADHPMNYLVLYNIGKCYEQLFQYGRAMEYYRRYLNEGGSEAEDAGEVRAKVQILQGLLGTIEITVNVDHFQVWIDGQRVGTDEHTFLVPGGTHQVEVRAAGYESGQEEVQLPARETRALTFELDAFAAEYEGLSPAIFWSATTVAAVSVIGGVALAGVARSRRGRVDDALAIGGTTAIAIATQEESDRIRGLSIGADVLFASGILFGATALVLAFTTDWDGDEGEASEQARVRFTFDGAVDRDGFDLRLGGSF